jgi:hypothetical protein
MAFNIKNTLKRKALGVVLGFGTALLLASCGGGGGSAGTQGGTGSSGSSGSGSGSSSTPTVTLKLVSPTAATTSLAAYGSMTITVQVLSNGVAGGSGVEVTFASPCAAAGKATLGSSATTGADGQATVTYTDSGCAASDIVTIASTGATSITETVQDAMPAAAAIQFVSASPTSDSIVIQGAGGNGRVSTATLTFDVVDTHGNPLPNQTVTFTLNPDKVVTLEQTSAITDATGKVIASVSSGTTATTFRVNASVVTTVNNVSTTLTTQSDSIIVTTGQTSQPSFSLSAQKYNIEGWNIDGTETPVSVFLADANGNPVADGTPVVFSTNSGAIGSSANGGCTTTNGECTVQFRSQNPRFGAGTTTPPSTQRAGVATVVASTTTSNETFGDSINIFLSGSSVVNPVLSIASTDGSVNGLTVTLTSCNTTTVHIQLNDVNNNPMPAGTTVAASATTYNSLATAVVGSVYPTTVLNTSFDNTIQNATTALLGTWHGIQFSPGGGTGAANACNAIGSGQLSGEIDVNVSVPSGLNTRIPVTILYPH